MDIAYFNQNIKNEILYIEWKIQNQKMNTPTLGFLYPLFTSWPFLLRLALFICLWGYWGEYGAGGVGAKGPGATIGEATATTGEGAAAGAGWGIMVVGVDGGIAAIG